MRMMQYRMLYVFLFVLAPLPWACPEGTLYSVDILRPSPAKLISYKQTQPWTTQLSYRILRTSIHILLPCTWYENMHIGIALDEMHSGTVLSLFGIFFSSCSWSWEWRERRVDTGTDVTLAGGVWLRSTVCVLAIGTRGRICTTNEYQISPSTDIRNREISRNLDN